jgi:hypothetical protein
MKVDIVLELDLKWREAELASLKRLAINSSVDSVAYQSLLRAMWALLYAHFEGFTKFCWDTILDHIQSEKIPTKQLSDRFALLALEKDFMRLRASLDATSIWEFFDKTMPAALGNQAAFPEKTRLKTESNLWPNVFERESEKLGIICSELTKHRARIKTLVARRNDIAHGKGMTIANLAEYHDYENATLCLMHELAIKAIEIIDTQIYRAETLAAELADEKI